VQKGKVQNAMTPSDVQQAVVNASAVPAKALVDAPQIADVVEKGINTFMEEVPVLMKILDEVAKVHPFISGTGDSILNTRVLIDGLLVTVLAFKAVYAFEATRRSNDKKVIALYVG
jgi:hypothetical protein